MTNDSRENLSSFVDGEMSQDSARFLVRRLASDEQLRATWARYHLIRDCMRHQDGGYVGGDLPARVQGVIAEEPAPAASQRAGGWLRAAAGAAIAASVALAAVMVVAPETAPGPQSAAGVVSQGPAAEPFVSPNIGAALPASQPVNLSGTEASSKREIDPYLLRHYQVTGGAGGRGFVSFVPIVVTRDISSQEAPAGQAAPEAAADSREDTAAGQ